MRQRIIIWVLAAAAGCGGDKFQGEGTEIPISICDPGGVFTSTITNRFFPLPIGQKATYEGDGTHLEITVLDEVEVVGGVTTRVVKEHELEGGQLVEESWNYFAQTADGTVCYFGERVDMYKNGTVVGHEGQWRADERGFQPGIQMPGEPMAGTFHAQENAPDVAQDYANIVAVGVSVTVPKGTFTDTVVTEEWSPLEPGTKEGKSYAAGVGLLDDDGTKLVSIEVAQ